MCCEQLYFPNMAVDLYPQVLYETRFVLHGQNFQETIFVPSELLKISLRSLF